MPTNEPQKRFPRVSDCCKAELQVRGSGEGTYFYQCTQCLFICNAVADEGLPSNEKSECEENSEKPKIANSSEILNTSEAHVHPKASEVMLSRILEYSYQITKFAVLAILESNEKKERSIY